MMKKTFRIAPGAMVLAIAFSHPAPASAAVWSSTNIEYLYGWNYRLSGTEREAGTVTLEHASGFAYGDNFFFLDILEPFYDKTEPEALYGQWDPRFSLGKITGLNLAAGPIGDVLLTGELGYGANKGGFEREYNYGLGVDLKIPGFAYFGLNLWVHDDVQATGVTYQVSPYWGAPFHLGTVGFLFEGFLDYVGAEGEGANHKHAYVISQPRFLLDVGSLWHKEGNLFAGTEVELWFNKYGVDDINEVTPQAMVKWVF